MSRLDWLEAQLERDDLTLEQRRKYETEADKIANGISAIQERQQKAREERRAHFQALKQQLQSGNLSAIDTHGIPEFGSDYEIVQEGSNHVVYSRVAADGQNDRHPFGTYDEANSKFRKLVWDRLYSKYVRQGDVDHLDQLFE